MQPHFTTLPEKRRTGPARIPLADRFWTKVEKGPSCWLWTGTKDRRYGTGLVLDDVTRRLIATHRVSYTLTYGPIPEGVRVFHACETPLCVRPDHLYLGSDTLPPPERFWARVKKTEDCWEWTGPFTGSGKLKYGILPMLGRRILASHISWELYFGPVPDGLFVCHHCDNPACVRPDHLFLGTPADNMHDMRAKGREKIIIGEAHPNARLTEEDVRCIRQRAAGGAMTVTLAREYGVSSTTIFHIRQRNKWKHVV